MAVEVKNMIVKSNVVQREPSGQESGGRVQVSEELKNAILEECKRMIQETVREMKER